MENALLQMNCVGTGRFLRMTGEEEAQCILHSAFLRENECFERQRTVLEKMMRRRK